MRKIRLNESQFNRLVKNCVKKALKENEEGIFDTYQSFQHAQKMLNYAIIDDDKVDDVFNAMCTVLSKDDILNIVDELIANGVIDPKEFPIYGV